MFPPQWGPRSTSVPQTASTFSWLHQLSCSWKNTFNTPDRSCFHWVQRTTRTPYCLWIVTSTWDLRYGNAASFFVVKYQLLNRCIGSITHTSPHTLSGGHSVLSSCRWRCVLWAPDLTLSTSAPPGCCSVAFSSVSPTRLWHPGSLRSSPSWKVQKQVSDDIFGIFVSLSEYLNVLLLAFLSR